MAMDVGRPCKRLHIAMQGGRDAWCRDDRHRPVGHEIPPQVARCDALTVHRTGPASRNSTEKCPYPLCGIESEQMPDTRVDARLAMAGRRIVVVPAAGDGASGAGRVRLQANVRILAVANRGDLHVEERALRDVVAAADRRASTFIRSSSGLNLVVVTITLWNTMYREWAIAAL